MSLSDDDARRLLQITLEAAHEWCRLGLNDERIEVYRWGWPKRHGSQVLHVSFLLPLDEQPGDRLLFYGNRWLVEGASSAWRDSARRALEDLEDEVRG